MKKILFPFELDNPAYRDAYVFAVKFARNITADLILLHVFDIDMNNTTTREEYNKMVRNKWYKAYLETNKFNNHYLENFVRVDNELRIKVDYRFIHGKLQNEIRKIIINEPVDLIVLPVFDEKSMNKQQLEIIQDNIFEKNRASLLIIPFCCGFKPVKKIVFATDLKKLNDYRLYLNDVIRFANIFDSNIHFIHITKSDTAFMPEDSEAYRTMMKIIYNNSRHVFKSFHGTDIIDSVNEYAEQNNADLLVVVKHQHYFLDSILHRSVTDEISMRSKIPVLVMREKGS